MTTDASLTAEIARLNAKNAALSKMHLEVCASLKDAKDQEAFWKEQNGFTWGYVDALNKDMRRIAGMAGNPDAAQGCRDILAVIREQESGVAE